MVIAIRHADQVRILELHAGAFVAIVIERVDAGGEAIVVDLARRFAQRRIGIVHRRDDHRKRRDGRGQEHARVVVILLDRTS